MSWVDEMLSEILFLDEEIKYRKRQLQEAIDHNITTTKDEINRENVKFASRLRDASH